METIEDLGARINKILDILKFAERRCRVRIPQFSIYRDSLLSDSLRLVREHSRTGFLSSHMSIKFAGEAGIDAGGLYRDWSNALIVELSKNGVFVETEPGKYILGSGDMALTKLSGKMIAKFIADRQAIPIRFTRSIYKMMIHGMGVPLGIDDFVLEYPTEGANLRAILENDVSENPTLVQDLTFSVGRFNSEGRYEEVELVDGGSNVEVTEANKNDYIELLIEYKLRNRFRSALEVFLNEFHSLIPVIALRGKFTPEELEKLMAGETRLDIDDLKANTEYIGYLPTSDVVQWFWEVLGEYDEEHHEKFLKFVTGTSVIPLGGFGNIRERSGLVRKFSISRTGIHDSGNSNDNPLPSAHTCSMQLDLPQYTTKEEVRIKLTQAITMGNFGFAFA